MRERGTPGSRGLTDENNYQEHLLPQLMPRLLWLVRDHKMSLKDKQGNQLVENEFFELALSEIAKSTSRKLSSTRD